MKNYKVLSVLVCVVSLLAFQDRNLITVHMIGDSTMSIKKTTSKPETGWGEPFAIFFDESVEVINHAKNGRSSRTFREEGRWEPVLENLKAGDYVFIQFGHNDEVQTKKASTKPEEFRANLERYISETQAKGATPILLTAIARRHFDDAGYLEDTHREFADITRAVASEAQVPFIDMDSISRGYLTRLGEANSELLYLHLSAGEHPNHPNGRKDNTHFSEYGARVWAQLVLAELRKSELELTSRVVVKGK